LQILHELRAVRLGAKGEILHRLGFPAEVAEIREHGHDLQTADLGKALQSLVRFGFQPALDARQPHRLRAHMRELTRMPRKRAKALLVPIHEKSGANLRPVLRERRTPTLLGGGLLVELRAVRLVIFQPGALRRVELRDGVRMLLRPDLLLQITQPRRQRRIDDERVDEDRYAR
jgi:hypothetical protein